MTDNVTGWEVCGLFLPSVTPLWKKPHELGFLISLPCTMRPWSLERWSLWMQEVSQQRCIWWGCQAPSHQPGTQRVAFFNAPLLESLNTSSLTVFIPCSVYPSLNDSYEQKTLLSCSLCIFSFPFVFPFFSPILLSVKLGMVKAQSTYFGNKQRHSESLQVSRESCQVWGFSVFPFFFAREKGCKLACRGVCLCWVAGDWRTAGVLETNQVDSVLQALAAFLTTVRKIQAKPVQILPLSIFIIISRELPGIPPLGKYVILSKAKVPIVHREKWSLINMHQICF